MGKPTGEEEQEARSAIFTIFSALEAKCYPISTARLSLLQMGLLGAGAAAGCAVMTTYFIGKGSGKSRAMLDLEKEQASNRYTHACLFTQRIRVLDVLLQHMPPHTSYACPYNNHRHTLMCFFQGGHRYPEKTNPRSLRGYHALKAGCIAGRCPRKRRLGSSDG